jgi:large subunit ribosomal protein L28
MSRRCELTGVGVQFGNNVSHSQRKTRRSFRPNLKVARYKSEITGQEYKLKITTSCIRSVEKAGGFDSFILSAKACKMSDKAKVIKSAIAKKYKVGVAA